MYREITENIGKDYMPIYDIEAVNKKFHIIYEGRTYYFVQQFQGELIFANGKRRITINPKGGLAKYWEL
jgi:hypothetical protein